MGGARTADGPGNSLDGLGEPDRVEPDVRILALAEQIEGPARARVDRVLERGLEAATDVHHELRAADRVDVARRELEVVRLGTRRSQIDDVVSPVGSHPTRSVAHASG